MVPVALQTAIEEDEEFRHSLPSNYLDFMGVVHSDEVCVYELITKYYVVFLFSLQLRSKVLWINYVT